MKNSDLNQRLREANPVPGTPFPREGTTSAARRFAQVVLAVFAAGLLGVGVAWAASGTNPIASLFSEDLVVVESDLGFEEFSILEPITQQELEALPRGAAQAAIFNAISRQIARNTMNGLPPFGRDKSRFDPDPALISAVGRGETNLGNPVTFLVTGEQICSFTGKEGFGRGSCGDLDSVAQGKVVSWGSDGVNHLSLSAIFNDEVAAIDIEGDAEPPIKIPDNALELRKLSYRDITLVGLDENGTELFRNTVPTSMRP